jgi:NitT/TauT family transport system substrate-binding protein
VAEVPGRADSITFVTDLELQPPADRCVALERGYYKQVGLDVSFMRGSGSVDAIGKIRSGAARGNEIDLTITQGLAVLRHSETPLSKTSSAEAGPDYLKY